MAQPVNKSPRRLFGDPSPPGQQSLSTSPHNQHALVQSNGQRQMLPPSPQTYYPRIQHQAFSISNGNPPQNVSRDLPPPQHRPSSSMSISSMLGSEPDRPYRDQNPNITPGTTSPYHARPQNPFSDMSPPQHSIKPNPVEYSYKPRSQTPDRMGISNLLGTRPYRSGSGSIMQSPTHSDDSARASGRAGFPTVGEPMPQLSNQELVRRSEQPVSHATRTSISGILQRPSSQPQPQVHSTPTGQPVQPVNHPQPNRPAWSEHSNTQNLMSFNNPSPPTPAVKHGSEYGKGPQNGQQAPSTTAAPPCDIRRPGFISSVQQQSGPPQDHNSQPGESAWERPPSNPISPGTRRQVAGTSPMKPQGGLPHGQPTVTKTADPESQQVASVPMSQQHSSQSHKERSIFGERLDKGRSRPFSPFANSQISQGGPSAPAASDDQGRKGSDELSQHRALLGLAAESRKGGRYSPLPQAVQGAQAQSIGPEIGIKTEHGRIFSGIGTGVGTASASPAHGPPGLVASPFRRDDHGPRSLNEEDSLMKMARSSSAFGKRARMVKEEDEKPASQAEGSGRVGKKPRNHHHHYRLDDNRDLSSPFDLQRRTTPLSSLNPIRRTSTPNHSASNPTHHHHHRPHQHHRHHHHHHHHHAAPAQKPFKPNTMIKIGAVTKAAASNPRRHLGFSLYSPIITVPDLHTPVRTKLNVSIRPNLLPRFKDPLQVNCTHTVRVSRTWLRHAEREAICAERFLWGSGIYSDDSDPIAAAIHSGFIKGAWSDWVDTALLEQIISEQNPTIDVRDNVPESPVEPPDNKDLHITLLVLPQLDRYEESVRYGVKSRTWPEEAKDAPHDGVSFMVWNCEWVDEGSARGQDRSGVAKRKRLQALMAPPQPVAAA